MSEFNVGLAGGILVGILISFIFVIAFKSDIHDSGVMALHLCEQDLPRNQRCLITAIPEEL